MAINFGATTLPLAQPDVTVDGLLDHSLDVLAEAIPLILHRWLDDAWNSVEPGLSLIGAVYRFDPERVFDPAGQVNVNIIELPGLYIYSREVGNQQLCDAHQEEESEISIFWVPPSRQTSNNSRNDTLFRAFAKAIGQIVHLERDIGWVSETDKATSDDPPTEARRVAARRLGSSIPDACGFSRWHQESKHAVIPHHFLVGTDRYDGFLAKISVFELSNFDAAAAGYAPTSLQQTLDSGGSTPFSTGGFLKP